MKKLIALSLLCLSFLAPVVRAQSSEDLTKVNFTGVKTIQIADVAGVRYAHVTLQITNGSADDIRVTDALYSIEFKLPDPKATVVEGEPKPYKTEILLELASTEKAFYLPKGSMLSKGKGEAKVVVELGRVGAPGTDEKLIKLFNLAAGGTNDVQIVLTGTVNFVVVKGKVELPDSRRINWILTPKPMERVIFSD